MLVYAPTGNIFIKCAYQTKSKSIITCFINFYHEIYYSMQSVKYASGHFDKDAAIYRLCLDSGGNNLETLFINIKLTTSLKQMNANPLKIGLFLNSNLSSVYLYNLAEWARRQEGIEISHLIIIKPRIYLKSTLFDMVFSKIISIEKQFLKFNKIHNQHFDTFDLRKVVSGELEVNPISCNEKSIHEFSCDDIDRVKSLNLDLLIHCGSGEFQNEILNASRLGTISFNNRCNAFHRTDFSCFWECFNQHPKTGFYIQKVTNEYKEKQILLSGFYQTKFSFSWNQANVFRKSSTHFQNLLLRISLSRQLPTPEATQLSFSHNYEVPKAYQGIEYLGKVGYRLAKKIVYQISNFKKRWGLSVTQSDWRGILSKNSINGYAPKGYFWADPFIYTKNNKTYCFVEDFSYKTNLGKISALEIENGTITKIGDCIKEPFHLSFPFLFNYNDNLYMCPESSAARQIRVYRSTDFPLKWELSSVIMDNVCAADTVLFSAAGLWWMLTSIDKSGSDDYTSELYLFSASSPLASQWNAHPQNPVRIDSDGGRNAGLIQEDGKIYRLAQRQGYDQYGEGILMYEITELSESVYVERLLPAITPPLTNGMLGIHHLSTTGNMSVFDHASRVFYP